jgi:hypothetical protein
MDCRHISEDEIKEIIKKVALVQKETVRLLWKVLVTKINTSELSSLLKMTALY